MPTPAILDQPNKKIFKSPIYLKLENPKQGLIILRYSVKSIILHYLNSYKTFLVDSLKELFIKKNIWCLFSIALSVPISILSIPIFCIISYKAIKDAKAYIADNNEIITVQLAPVRAKDLYNALNERITTTVQLAPVPLNNLNDALTYL